MINDDITPLQLQFAALDGKPVHLETLEAILKLRPLNIGEIKNFYTNYGERYLKLYAERSTMLESMFFEVIDNNDPGKLDILKIWLRSAPMSQEKIVQLIKRTCTTIPDYIWMVSGYGLIFLKSGKPELEALCLGYFQAAASSSEGSKYKKQWLFTFCDADLRDGLKEQLILRAQLTGRDRNEFVWIYSHKMLPFFYRSSAALQMYADAIVAKDGIRSAEKITILLIWLGNNLTLEELEGVLRISELVDGDPGEMAQILEEQGKPYIDLYLSSPPELFAKSTMKRCLLSYLAHFNVEGFKTRETTPDLLQYLTMFPLSWDQNIQQAAGGWLDFREFLIMPARLTQYGMTKLEGVFQKLIKSEFISAPARANFDERLAYALEGSIASSKSSISSTQRLYNTLIRMERFATKEQQLDILRKMCAIARLRYQKEKRDVRVLLPYIEVVPCLQDILIDEADPRVLTPEEQKKLLLEQKKVLYEMWDILLKLPDVRPEMLAQIQEEMFRQIQTHIHDAEKLKNWDHKISEAWLQYENDRRVRKPKSAKPPYPEASGAITQGGEEGRIIPTVPALVPQLPTPQFQGPLGPGTPVLPPVPVTVSGGKATSGSLEESTAIIPIQNMQQEEKWFWPPLWWRRMWSVPRMKWALRNEGKNQVIRAVKAWQKYYDVLQQPEQMVALGQERWEKLVLVRDFHVAREFANQPDVVTREPLLKYGYDLAILRLGNDIMRFGNAHGGTNILNGVELSHLRRAGEAVKHLEEIYQPDLLKRYADV
jgi:hypothetical protein